ncbi:MAG: hypothetical protein QXL17_07880 [Candidatus Thermoplasmatota archaeon]
MEIIQKGIEKSKYLAGLVLTYTLVSTANATSLFGSDLVDNIGDTIDDIATLIGRIISGNILSQALSLMLTVMIYGGAFMVLAAIFGFITGIFKFKRWFRF